MFFDAIQFFQDSNIGQDSLLTVAYDAAGNELWARTYRNPAYWSTRAQGLAVGADGHVVVLKDADLEVVAFSVDHGPVHPAVGYRIRYKDRSVVHNATYTTCERDNTDSWQPDWVLRAGTIHIAVAPVASSGGRFVEIAVADDGPGIPDHLLGSVFDPFVTGRPDSGTGLGLYLIQEYLYSAGGTVEVESSPQGATFRLRFPAP